MFKSRGCHEGSFDLAGCQGDAGTRSFHVESCNCRCSNASKHDGMSGRTDGHYDMRTDLMKSEARLGILWHVF